MNVASKMTNVKTRVISQTNVMSALISKTKELGWRGIWRGIFPRMGMVGIMAASQLLIYDASKVLIFGLSVTQGIPSRTTN